MRLLALVPSLYDTSPGQRFRLEQWEPWLRKRGVEITYEPFETESLNRVLYQPGNFGRKLQEVGRALNARASVVRRARQYDAVYVFREAALLGPPIFERWLHSFGVPMIFDFDDAVFVPYKSPTNGYLSLLKFPAKTRTICRLSAHVMAGNPYLANYARQVNKRVTIIPTTIDTDKYMFEPKRVTAGATVIGWSGSHSTEQHLHTLGGALQRLAKQERFRLRVIGAPNFRLEGVEVEALPWRAATETNDLRALDIGVMPLPDDAWSLGKCGLKALQYMALGVPTVCSPVGVNSDIIQHGDNGFLAATEDEWVERLRELLHSAELRGRLGSAGRATVEERYSAAAQAPRVFRLIESVLSGAKAERKTISGTPPVSLSEGD